MGKELKGLLDWKTYDKASSAEVSLSQVQNAPARMVYVVKPAIAEDGTLRKEKVKISHLW
eukprot:4841875-Amphidinium_carterae.3